jgi:shikimate kinase
MNIYLVGYRCAGKSTVGRLLAEKLGWSFVDMDDYIVKAEGRTIAQLVDDEGWDHFRRLEHRLVVTLAKREDTIVSTGGGVLMNPANTLLMQGSGKIVWLKVSQETVVDRIGKDPSSASHRPSLTGAGVADDIEATLKTRNPIYQKGSDLTVDTDTLEPEAVVAQVLGNLY